MEFKNRTIQIVSQFDGGLPPHMQEAVGYLSAWALGSDRYCRLRITIDERGYMEGVYRDGKDEITYVIGALPGKAVNARGEAVDSYSYDS